MAGKPAHLNMVGGKEPRQHMWEAIRALREGFTPYAVARRAKLDDQAVDTYILALAKAGIIEVVIAGTNKKKATYRLAKDEGADHPRLNANGERTKVNHAVENVWRSLRILGGPLTAAELAHAASVGDTQISEGRTNRYLVALVKAGYLAHTKGLPGRPATFRLLPARYTGPRHPIVQELESIQVYDPNLDKVVWASASDQPQDSQETTWARIEIDRLRGLLAEWLRIDDWQDGHIAPPALVQRTQLELAPVTAGATQ